MGCSRNRNMSCPISHYEHDRVYRLIVKSAERIVKQNIAAFKQSIESTRDYEQIMAKREMRLGNQTVANCHRMRAEIYQSVLDRM